jgi:hypothetical protein
MYTSKRSLTLTLTLLEYQTIIACSCRMQHRPPWCIGGNEILYRQALWLDSAVTSSSGHPATIQRQTYFPCAPCLHVLGRPNWALASSPWLRRTRRERCAVRAAGRSRARGCWWLGEDLPHHRWRRDKQLLPEPGPTDLCCDGLPDLLEPVAGLGGVSEAGFYLPNRRP